jgi:hypothetical protein
MSSHNTIADKNKNIKPARITRTFCNLSCTASPGQEKQSDLRSITEKQERENGLYISLKKSPKIA